MLCFLLGSAAASLTVFRAAGAAVVGGGVVGVSEDAAGVSAGRPPADPEKRSPLIGALEGTSIVPPALKVR
jgi:hypothetical protein